jgi:hypothetical protein
VGVESCPHAPRNIIGRILGRAARRAHDLILMMTAEETKGNGLPPLGRSLVRVPLDRTLTSQSGNECIGGHRGVAL